MIDLEFVHILQNRDAITAVYGQQLTRLSLFSSIFSTRSE